MINDVMKALAVMLLAALFSAACANAQTIDPALTQVELQSAWRQPWHGSWELDWPQAPIPGPLIAEVWSANNGEQRRYEILEAPVASLIGLAYITGGTSAAYYNRLENTPPVTGTAQSLPFSPLSDAFQQIDNLLAQTPQAAEQVKAGSANAPVTEYRLVYPNNTTLTLWLDTQNKLVIRLQLNTPTDELTLASRSLGALVNPHPRLFSIEN